MKMIQYHIGWNCYLTLGYFTDVYVSTNITHPNSLISEVIPHLVIELENFNRTTIPQPEEIKGVVLSLQWRETPGSDGYGSYFFQAFWEIVGEDVCKSVCQFFLQSWLLPKNELELRDSYTKSQGANKIEHFRPILLLISIQNHI
ncbi:hypothetical protein Lal_00029720 [Lupinus albus]|nr:hypothetical protein Lal_00029720 [Lupinus albus]